MSEEERPDQAAYDKMLGMNRTTLVEKRKRYEMELNKLNEP